MSTVGSTGSLLAGVALRGVCSPLPSQSDGRPRFENAFLSVVVVGAAAIQPLVLSPTSSDDASAWRNEWPQTEGAD